MTTSEVNGGGIDMETKKIDSLLDRGQSVKNLSCADLHKPRSTNSEKRLRSLTRGRFIVLAWLGMLGLNWSWDDRMKPLDLVVVANEILKRCTIEFKGPNHSEIDVETNEVQFLRPIHTVKYIFLPQFQTRTTASIFQLNSNDSLRTWHMNAVGERQKLSASESSSFGRLDKTFQTPCYIQIPRPFSRLNFRAKYLTPYTRVTHKILPLNSVDAMENNCLNNCSLRKSFLSLTVTLLSCLKGPTVLLRCRFNHWSVTRCHADDTNVSSGWTPIGPSVYANTPHPTCDQLMKFNYPND